MSGKIGFCVFESKSVADETVEATKRGRTAGRMVESFITTNTVGSKYVMKLLKGEGKLSIRRDEILGTGQIKRGWRHLFLVK